MSNNTNSHLNNRYDVLARHRGRGDLSSFFSNPISSKPKPTSENYKQGFMNRYFVRKATSPNFPIYEVDSSNFQLMRKNPFYSSATVNWKLTGDIDSKEIAGEKLMGVTETNTININKANLVISGIKSLLKNPLEFYKKL